MINNQGQSDLLITSLVSGELSYQPRTGNWELDIINRTESWSDHIFDIQELPYDTKIDHALFLGFYNEPYRAMLRKAIGAAKLLGTPWELDDLCFFQHRELAEREGACKAAWGSPNIYTMTPV